MASADNVIEIFMEMQSVVVVRSNTISIIIINNNLVYGNGILSLASGSNVQRKIKLKCYLFINMYFFYFYYVLVVYVILKS